MGSDVVFAIFAIEAIAGERLPADALILPTPVFIAVLEVCRVTVAELMRSADAELRIPRRRRHIGLVITAWVVGGWNNVCIHYGVEVFFGAIESGEKAALGCEEDRPGYVAFIDASLLVWLRWCQRILRTL